MARKQKSQKQSSKQKSRTGTNWSQVKDLGKVPDSKIAKRLHLTPQAVLMARKRLGIPAFSPSGRPAAQAPARSPGKPFEPHPALQQIQKRVSAVVSAYETIAALYAAPKGRGK